MLRRWGRAQPRERRLDFIRAIERLGREPHVAPKRLPRRRPPRPRQTALQIDERSSGLEHVPHGSVRSKAEGSGRRELPRHPFARCTRIEFAFPPDLAGYRSRNRIDTLRALRNLARSVREHPRLRPAPDLIGQLIAARQLAAVVEEFLQCRNKFAKECEQRVQKAAMEQATNLTAELQLLHRVVEGCGQHGGGKRHDVFLGPGRAQHAHLNAQRREIIREPVVRFGDDVRNREPVFESVHIY